MVSKNERETPKGDFWDSLSGGAFFGGTLGVLHGLQLASPWVPRLQQALFRVIGIPINLLGNEILRCFVVASLEVLYLEEFSVAPAFPTHGGFWRFKEPSHSKFGYEEMFALFFSEKNEHVSTFNCPSVHFISQHVSHVLGSIGGG